MSVLRRPVNWLRRKLWLSTHRNSRVDSGAPHRPRLLVDLSVIARHDARTGIQRVVRGIWAEMSRRGDFGFDVVPVHATAISGYCYLDQSHPDGRLTPTSNIVHGRQGDIFLGLDFAAHVLPHWAQQFATWRRAGVSLRNVVYDLLPLRRPEWFTPASRKHFRRWFDIVSTSSDQLLCISKSVASDVRDILNRPSAPEVKCFSLSGDIAGSLPSGGMTTDMQTLLERVASRSTVLMVGTIEPRKGHDAALNAFDWLWEHQPDDAPDLVIVGKAGWRTGELQERLRQHRFAQDRLTWIEDATDQALNELYMRCSAVLVTSRAEGFGLPLSEAAFHGKWVLARKLPVFVDQGLSNCAYFENENPDALGRDILALVRRARLSPPLETDLIGWRETVDELLEAMRIGPNPQKDDASERVAGLSTPAAMAAE